MAVTLSRKCGVVYRIERAGNQWAVTLSRKCGVVYRIDRAVNHCGCYTE